MVLKRVITLGTRGSDVKACKRAMARAGYGAKKLASITDLYGPYAVTFTKRFQKAKGLPADGIIGQRTLDELAPYFDAYALKLYADYVPTAHYVNPLRDAHELVPLRTDQGVDYMAKIGSPIVAIGRCRVTRATTTSGWPGGGCVQYVLLDGDHKGEEVYVAEFITPTVAAGEIKDAGSVLAVFNRDHSSGVGIETGYIRPGTHEPCQSDTSGNQTVGGKAFARFLRKLGCPTQQDPGPGSDRSPCA